MKSRLTGFAPAAGARARAAIMAATRANARRLVTINAVGSSGEPLSAGSSHEGMSSR